MRKMQIVAVAILCLAALARLAQAEMEAVPPEMKFREDEAATKFGDVGLFRDYQFTSDGRRYDARILIPQNYDPQKPVGLLFGFHGYSTKLRTEPTLDALWDMEYYAEEEYMINVSLSMSYRPEVGGWQYGWDHSHTGLQNPDVNAVDTLLRLMKTNYNVDKDRIFANGTSNGAGFCLTIMHNLPGVFAAVAPENPVAGYALATPQNPTAIFVFGGLRDDWDTGNTVKRLTGEMFNAHSEFIPHIWNQPHVARRVPDNFVSPALTWEDEVMEFFRTHPRDYQSFGYTPAVSAQMFSDAFDAPGESPASANWRVEPYNAQGIVGDLGGYRFVKKDGELVNALAEDSGAAVDLLEATRAAEAKKKAAAQAAADAAAAAQAAQDAKDAAEAKDAESTTLGSFVQNIVNAATGAPAAVDSATVTVTSTRASDVTVAGAQVVIAGPQGGLCRTGFFTQPVVKVHVECVVHQAGGDLIVAPLWIGDGHGRVFALNLAGGKAAWSAYATHHDFMTGNAIGQAGQGGQGGTAGATGGSQSGTIIYLADAASAQGTAHALAGSDNPDAGPGLFTDAKTGIPMINFNFVGALKPPANTGPAMPAGTDLTIAAGAKIAASMEIKDNKAQYSVTVEGQPAVTGEMAMPEDAARQFGFGLLGTDASVGFDNVSIAETPGSAVASASVPVN